MTSSPPTEHHSIAGLQELIALWAADAPKLTVPVGGDHWGGPLAVWVQANHSVGLAEAVVALYAGGMRIQAVPLLRLVMECGVTAAWLVKVRGAALAAFAESSRQYVLLARAIEHMTGEQFDEDLEGMLAQTDQLATDEGKKFIERCKNLDGGAWMYANYRFLSQYSHGGASLVNAYVRNGEIDPQYGHGLHLVDPQLFDHRDAMLAISVAFLHMALTAWATIGSDLDLAEALDDFGSRNDLTVKFEPLVGVEQSDGEDHG